MPDPFFALLQSLGVADPTGSGWKVVVLTFLLAALLTWRFTPRVRAFALRAGWADEGGGRRQHQGRLPNAGGLAVYAGVVTSLAVAGAIRPIVVDDVLIQLLAVLLGGTLLLFVGFLDDQFGLSPWLRLLAQTLAALLAYGAGVRIEAAFGSPLDPLLSLVLTWLWLVGITNAMNLIDGLDGLAGGIALITAISLLFASAQFETRAAATLMLAALAGAALGFLRHNLPPSKIIMGDAGAYFFGYVLAAAAILGYVKVTTVFSLVPVALFLAVPILDTTWVFFRRLLAGKNPLSNPGRDHLHHRLLARGFSTWRAVALLWGATLVADLLALWLQGIPAPAIAATGITNLGLLAFVIWRRRREA